MKKNYVVIATLFIYQVTLAQITLTKATSTPSIGDSYNMITFSAISGVRQSGANKTWNLSTVSTTGNVPYTYVAKSGLSESSYFPQSNLADTFNLIQSFAVKSSTTWASEGTALPPLFRTVYSDKREWIDFPITYNNSFSETFSGTYTTFFPTTTTINRSGTIQIKADAYGTLILPYATVPNVLRVMNISNYTEVSGSITDTYIDTTYSWFNLTTHSPIVTYNITYKNGSLDFEGGGYMNQSDIIIGINDLVKNDNLILYPNPVKNELTLDMKDLNPKDEIYYTITDVQGKIITNNNVTLNGQILKINTTKLAQGIYLLQLIYNHKNITKKFIKN